MKSILIIVPYDNIYPPMNGGMQRCFHIMYQLAKYFELTAIIHQNKESFLKSVKEYPALASVKINSTTETKPKDVFNLLPPKFEKAFRYRWYKKQLRGPADGSFLQYYPVLKKLLAEKEFDVIILENMATLNAVEIIRRYNKKVKIIYDAHNVDTNLAKSALERKEISPTQLQNYYDCERNLYQKVNAIFTCSREDKEIFISMNQGKLMAEVVPNGVSIPKTKYDAGVKQEAPEFILFCGSLWSIPNAEGLHWFCKKIWPLVHEQIPSLKLLVIGSGKLPDQYADITATQSIEFIGAVDDIKPWYNKAALAVVPLLTGSGTRLKVLEAMGLGVPVISTTIGAEGIDYTEGENILIADKEENFAKKVIELIQNIEKRISIQKKAISLVGRNYDWNIIGESLSDFLSKQS